MPNQPQPFRPSPGDRLREPGFRPGRYIQVLTPVSLDGNHFLGRDSDDDPTDPRAVCSYYIGPGTSLQLEPALPPHVFPERYIPLYKNGTLAAGNFETAEAAVRSTDFNININGLPHQDPYRTALLLHILPDGTTRWEDPPDDGIRTRGGDKWDVSAADVARAQIDVPLHPSIHGTVRFSEAISLADENLRQPEPDNPLSKERLDAAIREVQAIEDRLEREAQQ